MSGRIESHRYIGQHGAWESQVVLSWNSLRFRRACLLVFSKSEILVNYCLSLSFTNFCFFVKLYYRASVKLHTLL